MNPPKPTFTINIGQNHDDCLEALALLSNIDIDIGRHTQFDLRPALGIYNISLIRVCKNAKKCAEKFEQYIHSVHHIDDVRKESEIFQEFVDYIELSLYSAAEHVDDLDAIARGYFGNDREYAKSSIGRVFQQSIKDHKKFIAACANNIKHQQARIRIYSVGYNHGGIPGILHGYFIEGVNSGVVGPSKIFHDDKKQVFSISSLIWEIVIFILHASKALAKLIRELRLPILEYKNVSNSKFLHELVLSNAKLPVFSFDDIHPFISTTLIINMDDESFPSGNLLYGSYFKPWSNSSSMMFGGDSSSYAGDGVTKSFKLVHPSQVAIQHIK